jgi:hypothetical protein
LGSNKRLTKNCFCPLTIGIAIGEQFHRLSPRHNKILTSARSARGNRRRKLPSRDIYNDDAPT